MPKRMKKTKAKHNASKNPVIAALAAVLGDLYVLAVKNHGFHWNVTGPQFLELHEFFGKQYAFLTDAADDVAERIRALDARAPFSFAQFAGLATIAEEKNIPSADAMLAILARDYAILVTTLQQGMDIADDVDDDGSEDLLTGLLRDVQKQAWMVKALGG